MAIKTIAEQDFLNWNHNSADSALLKIYANKNFIASSGVNIIAGCWPDENWCQIVECTIVDNVLTIPEFTLEPTTDADNPDVTYTAVLESRKQRRNFIVEVFSLNHLLESPTSWSLIKLDNDVDRCCVPRNAEERYWTVNQTITYLIEYITQNITNIINNYFGENPITLDGDVTGAVDDNTVIALLGRLIDETAPSVGQAYVWNGTAWEAQDVQTPITDAMIFKGVIDASTNPNYPAADAGHVYRISVAGKIGGASGPNVEFQDMLICMTDGTVAGNHATVGADWTIEQGNQDGVVIGPASANDKRLARFDGASGKLIQESTIGVDDSGNVSGMKLDPEGTGNDIKVVEKLWFPGAGSNGGTAAPFWDLPAADAPTALDIAGSNVHKAGLSFPDSGLAYAETSFLLPLDWSGEIDCRIIWNTSAIIGNCKWSVQTGFCDVGATAVDDNAYNAAQTVTTAAPGTTQSLQNSGLTNLTNTGANPGGLMNLKISRDGTDGSDTIGADAILIGVEITLRRTV